MTDPINHPVHYTTHPSGIECIQITEHMSFNLGNAVKYIWRCDLKKDAVEDLKKAKWYIEREIAKRGKVKVEQLPESRGTSHQQLATMHMEAEALDPVNHEGVK